MNDYLLIEAQQTLSKGEDEHDKHMPLCSEFVEVRTSAVPWLKRVSL